MNFMSVKSFAIIVLLCAKTVSSVNPRHEAIQITSIEIYYSNEDFYGQPGNICDVEQYDRCFSKFLTSLSLDRHHSKADDLARRLMSLDAVYGRRGFQKICKAEEAFKKCLGENVDKCLTVQGIMNTGRSRSDAIKFLEIFSKKAYECSHERVFAGSGTWECLGMTVMDTGKDQLQQCHKEFVEKAEKHCLESANCNLQREICRFANEYNQCVQGIFEKHCGQTVSLHICQVVKISLDIRFPQCEASCRPIPNAEDHLTHFKHRGLSRSFATERHLINSFEKDGESGQCNGHRFGTCLFNYLDSLQISSNDTSLATEKVLQIFGKNKAGFERVCQALLTFDQCLGSEREVCMDTDNLVKMGMELDMATNNRLLYFGVDFTCRHRIYDEKYDCIMEMVGKRSETADQLSLCNRHFEQVMSQHHISHKHTMCKSLQTYGKCMQQASGKACGLDVGHTFCQASDNIMKLVSPQLKSCQVQCSNVESDYCDVEKFKQCIRTGHNELNIPTNNTIFAMLSFLQVIYRDINGYKEGCRIIKNFDKCISATPKCTSVDNLMRMGLSSDQAIGFGGLFAYINYQCSHNIFEQHFQCFLSVHGAKEKQAILNQCQKTFEQIITNKPTRSVACQALQQDATCQQRVFGDTCGSDIGEAFCDLVSENVKKLTKPWLDTCKIHCSTRHSSLIRKVLPHRVAQPRNSSVKDGQNEDIFDLMAEIQDGTGMCDGTKLRSCANAYKSELNISSKGVYGFIIGLKHIIEEQGKRGFGKICRDGTKFNRCIGGSRHFKDCIKISNLEKEMHLKRAEATLLSMTAFSLDFECSNSVFMENFDCIMETQKRKYHVFMRCEKRFRRDIMKHGMPCKATQQLLDCFSGPFKRECNQATGEAVCRLQKSLLETYMPHVKECPMHCNI